MTDPFSLQVHIGGGGDGKRYKTIAALRGSKEAEGRYGKFTVPLALSQILTFYIGEYRKIKRVGWTIQDAHFWIIAGNPNAEYQELGEGHRVDGEYWGYHIAGHFDILAEGDGKTRALRLLKWWIEWEPTMPRRIEMARYLGSQIVIRGRKEPDGFHVGPYDIEIGEPVFNPTRWDIQL